MPTRTERGYTGRRRRSPEEFRRLVYRYKCKVRRCDFAEVLARAKSKLDAGEGGWVSLQSMSEDAEWDE